jgi:hypothetical protein
MSASASIFDALFASQSATRSLGVSAHDLENGFVNCPELLMEAALVCG